MSKENITDFLSKAMAEKVPVQKLAELAAEHGYDIKAEELREPSAAQPLTDEELVNVTAGRLTEEEFIKKWIPPFDSRYFVAHQNEIMRDWPWDL